MTATDTPTDAHVVDVEGEEVTSPAADHEGDQSQSTAAMEVVPVPAGALTQPVASVEQTRRAFEAYQQLRDTIIVPADLQGISGKQFVKKSGWRKLGTVMGVSCEIVSRDYERDPQRRIISAEVVVRAIAPNGRYQDGLGVCDFHERCCPRAYDVEGQETPSVCKAGGSHTHCRPGCDGFNHFSKPQHDLPATAATRAQNRACSDLFGFGEVSAEEVGDKEEPADEADQLAIVAALNSIGEKSQRFNTKNAFAQRFGMPADLKKGQLEAARRFVTNAGGTFTDPAATGTPAPAPEASPTPTPPQADGGAADESSGSEGGEVSGSVSERATPASPPGSGTQAEPPQPSTARQRQTIGMAFRELVDEGLALESDKAEIVAIISLDRTTTTTEMTFYEAVKMVAAMHFLKQGTIKIVNDPNNDGGRALQADTAPGKTFLASLPKVDEGVSA